MTPSTSPLPALRRALLGLGLALAATAPRSARAQDAGSVEAFYRAVAQHFEVPSGEILILSEWRLPPEEIPVVLFVAGQAGISPEAVVAVRRSGQGWPAITRRYALDASRFHVPLEGGAGSLARAYEGYASRPRTQWASLELTGEDIVGLVNVRVLSEMLGVTPAAAIQARDRTGSWVAAFRSLGRR